MDGGTIIAFSNDHVARVPEAGVEICLAFVSHKISCLLLLLLASGVSRSQSQALSSSCLVMITIIPPHLSTLPYRKHDVHTSCCCSIYFAFLRQMKLRRRGIAFDVGFLFVGASQGKLLIVLVP